MNQQISYEGYICTIEERWLLRYAAPFGLVGMILFACVLWVEMLNNINNLVYWFITIIWSLFIIYFGVKFRRNQTIGNMRFYIDSEKVANISNSSRDTIVDLSENVFLTKITRDFAYGKSTVERSFYLISPKPYMIDYVRGTGLSTLKRLNDCGILIIPSTKETNAWIELNFKITTVPSFPIVAVIRQRTVCGKTGDGSLS